MEHVLFAQGLVQAEGRLDLGPDLGRKVRVLGVRGGVVARLGLNQEKGQADDHEQGKQDLSEAAY